jgi:hypothetical protein
MVRNPKLNGLVSPKSIAAPGQQHKQWVPKNGSSVDGSRGSQDQTWLRSEALTDNDNVVPNMERSPEEVAAKLNKVPEEKAETKIEVRTNSQRPPNRTLWFPKLDHLVSSSSRQKGMSRTTALRMTPTPHWCPPGLTSR